MREVILDLAEQVRAATAMRRGLRIRGGGTKDFYGSEPQGELMDTRKLRGIVAYEPSELVVTARAGASLAELEEMLAAEGQMLAFEPPHFAPGATVGGCIAAGLAGPQRASAGIAYGGVRDFVLGVRMLDGSGQVHSFGGTVMKNVAGYDVARVLAGSLGILGVILEASIKVLPQPKVQATLRFEMNQNTTLGHLNAWGAESLPIAASAWWRGVLTLRLSGAQAAVEAARRRLGGDLVEPTEADEFWRGIRNHTHHFFASDAEPLWRISVPSTTEMLDLGADPMLEWGGALRWCRTSMEPEEIRSNAARARGHATMFRGGDRSRGVFTPLSPPLMRIHRMLKAKLDPAGIFNPGRMYPDL